MTSVVQIYVIFLGKFFRYTGNKTVLINELNLKMEILSLNKSVVQGSLETVFMNGNWYKYFMGAADSTLADTMQVLHILYYVLWTFEHSI